MKDWKTLLIGFAWGVGLSAVTITAIYATALRKLSDESLANARTQQTGQAANYQAAQGAIDAWKRRAAVCEDRFAGATVIYEYHPAVSLPLLHGLAQLSLGSGADPMFGEAKPAWWIPGKVKVYTNQPGASYSWMGADGSEQGQWAATPPPQEAAQ